MLLDRPPHIQDKLCNVPALTVDDFEEPVLSGEKDIFRGTPRQRTLYVVYMVQLARIRMFISRTCHSVDAKSKPHSKRLLYYQIQ